MAAILLFRRRAHTPRPHAAKKSLRKLCSAGIFGFLLGIYIISTVPAVIVCFREPPRTLR